jgi:hypothetical protein
VGGEESGWEGRESWLTCKNTDGNFEKQATTENPENPKKSQDHHGHGKKKRPEEGELEKHATTPETAKKTENPELQALRDSRKDSLHCCYWFPKIPFLNSKP